MVTSYRAKETCLFPPERPGEFFYHDLAAAKTVNSVTKHLL